MSTRLREIKRRIRSTRQIHQVTGALQRVAAARLSRDRRLIEDAQAYTRRLVQLVWRVCAAVPEDGHPLMVRRAPVQTIVLLAFGADRGLCGRFNADLVDAAHAFLARRRGHPARIIAVGGVLARRLRRAGLAPDAVHAQPALPARAGLVDALAGELERGFAEGAWDEAHVLYSRFAPALQHVPIVEQVLPVAFGAQTGRGGAVVAFEPAAATILARLIPEFVRQTVDHAFLNSAGAENWARQEAMSRASRNAGDLLQNLGIEYSRERQENITTEMIELAGGAARPA